ncbi:MAG: aspartate-semialdehyde dehydrogenase [Planctomycetota bacterium]
MEWSSIRIAVLGASGAVGREILPLLAERGVRPDRLSLLGSARSAGTTMEFRDHVALVTEASDRSFEDADLALFAASGSAALRFAPIASSSGACVIDNSSAFREDPETPLVIPEVNASVLGEARPPLLIANPNCSTILLLVAVAPLVRAFGVRRLVVSTYQAASGAGAEAMAELEAGTRAALSGEKFEPRVFAQPAAFNCFSHDSEIDVEAGENVEERKMRSESRKILGLPDLAMTTTCIRVPVLRAHTETVAIELERPATEPEVRELLETAPGVRVIDDRAENRFPTPLDASGGADVLVGRLRPDPSLPSEGDAHHGYCLMLSGDQLLKGAALNAVQIADLVLPKL